MTFAEFKSVLEYITHGSGKSLADGKSMAVYFDCLQDLDFESFRLGAKWTLMNHKFATFPTIAELREASTQAARGTVVGLDPGEAWRMAEYLAAETDPNVSGSFENSCRKLARQLGRPVPPAVIQAVKNFGLEAICNSRDPAGVLRGQFMRIYEGVVAREKQRDKLPASLTQAIESRGKPLPVADVAKQLLDGIGNGGAK